MSEAMKKVLSFPTEADAEEESKKWERLSDKVRHLYNEVEEARDDFKKLPWSETAEYDHVMEVLEELKYYMKGREEELSPGTAEMEARLAPYSLYRKTEAPLAREAAVYGINYVALHDVYDLQTKADVMRYIVEHGLADMSYARTRYAVKEYRRKYLEEFFERELTPSEAEKYGVYTLQY